jgi:hypothetical protein
MLLLGKVNKGVHLVNKPDLASTEALSNDCGIKGDIICAATDLQQDICHLYVGLLAVTYFYKVFTNIYVPIYPLTLE